ncbi:MAG: universal stress protein [Bacteroidales bacterium]|nr:universal stress protein [Bacteroidales bacterium]
MEKIIVPIDFSEESICGLQLALIVANKFKADVQLVHVMKKKGSFFLAETEVMLSKVEAQLQKLIDEHRMSLDSECKFDYIIKKGRVFEEVVAQAEAFNNSMVICSTHGMSGFSSYFVGSNTYKIVQSTKRPVISVTTCQYIREIKKIVFPIDITKETREKAPLVAKIAKVFDAEVHIVKVTSSTNEGIHNKLKLYSNQICKFFDEQEVKHQKSLLVGDNITEITIDYGKTIDADLIAIMTEQTKSISNLLLGSYALQMLNNSPIPVLSITPRDLYLVHGFTPHTI